MIYFSMKNTRVPKGKSNWMGDLRMNNMMRSLVALGIGAAIYSRATDRNMNDMKDMFNNRSMKRIRKRVKKALR